MNNAKEDKGFIVMGPERILHEANNSKQIKLMAKSGAFTEVVQVKLEIVAEAFDRPIKK